jgi:NAD(P)-dependent dehydrogenase (short-subunit alcohol dehydrogenase family)
LTDETSRIAAAGSGGSDFLGRLFRLDGKTALVTGGSGDIGRALARGLAEAGAAVAVNGTSQAGTEAAVSELRALGLAAEPFVADLSDVFECEKLVERVVHAFGRLDVLVNCAGINRRKPILDVTPDDYEAIMAVNLRAAYFVSRAAARAMISQGGGKIVHIGSENSAIGLQTVSVYGAAKAGLSQLTKTMAIEWAEHGIQVNCLAPGFMHTRLTAVGLWGDERKQKWLLDRIPSKRPGEPADLVGTLLLLASRASDYITGQTIYVDGGFLAGSQW